MPNQLKNKIRQLLRRRRQAALLLVCMLVVVLTLTTCIGFVQRGNAVREHFGVRSTIADDLYNALHMFCQTYDQTQIPNIDEKVYVVPKMREYAAAARALSDILTKGYGPRYTVLDSSMKTALNEAFAAYDKAIETGEGTDRAVALLGDCVTKLRTILERRFVGGELKPS